MTGYHLEYIPVGLRSSRWSLRMALFLRAAEALLRSTPPAWLPRGRTRERALPK
jgi:hypothetical protein